MTYLKRLLLGLLLLFPIVLIINQPGIPILGSFYFDVGKMSLFNLTIKYPPAMYLVLSLILKAFPPNKNIYFFYNQNAWIFSKVLLFFSYYLTFFTIKHLSNSVNKKSQIKKIDLALSYFGSVSILLISVALSFHDIFAAPFFILTVSFLFKKRFNLAALFFLIALSFNWSLLVLGPFLFLFIYKNKRENLKKKIIPISGFVLLPIILFFINLIYLGSQSKSQNISGHIFGFGWLLNRLFEYISTHNSTGSINVNLGIIITALVSLLSIFLLIYLIRKLGIFKSFVILLISGLFLLKLNLVFTLLVSLFVSSYWKLITISKKKPFSSSILVGTSLSVYLLYTLFFPSISDGNIIWISILGLILFVVQKSAYSKILLLAINLIVFINMFIFFGSAGNITVSGDYFLVFQSVFSIISTLFAVKYISTPININLSSWLKKFLIILLIVLNFSLLTATGTGDNVSFNDTAILTVKYVNPFKVASVDLEMYPPLSTVIIGFFANASKMLIGKTEDYKLAVKISVLVFYFLTFFVFIKFSNKFQRKKTKTSSKLFVMLTIFSLIIQTQGFSDVNIYVIPTFVLSIWMLFNKRYLLSGLIFGLTFMIKPQPVFILPLFGATILDLKNIGESIKKTSRFVSGSVIVPVIVWSLVLINPGGTGSLKRFIDYIFNTSGFHLLSGQALNFNWVVTYLLHILEPQKHASLEYLGWYNWQTPSDYAPFIFRGLLFYIAAFLIYLHYWLIQKKNVFNFLGTSVIVFFTHQMLNKSAHEKHLFYATIMMLLLYLIRPTTKNRYLLILFDLMTIINLIMFYGFTGPKDFNRLFLNFDLTVLFAGYYVMVYFIILWNFFKGRILQSRSIKSISVPITKASNA